MFPSNPLPLNEISVLHSPEQIAVPPTERTTIVLEPQGIDTDVRLGGRSGNQQISDNLGEIRVRTIDGLLKRHIVRHPKSKLPDSGPSKLIIGI